MRATRWSIWRTGCGSETRKSSRRSLNCGIPSFAGVDADADPVIRVLKEPPEVETRIYLPFAGPNGQFSQLVAAYC